MWLVRAFHKLQATNTYFFDVHVYFLSKRKWSERRDSSCLLMLHCVSSSDTHLCRLHGQFWRGWPRVFILVEDSKYVTIIDSNPERY